MGILVSFFRKQTREKEVRESCAQSGRGIVLPFPSGLNYSSLPTGQKGEMQAALRPSPELEKELDRALTAIRKEDQVRLQHGQICRSNAHVFFNVYRLLREGGEELCVFCNTVVEGDPGPVSWGDVFGLTDLPDTYRYLFTLYTSSYVRECGRTRGENILPSPENIILNVPALTEKDVLQGTAEWINRYHPSMKNIRIRLEDPETVGQMIRDSLCD